MEATRRYWTVTGVGTFLAVWGVVVADPVPILGTAAIAAWLLATQYRFVRAATGLPDDCTVELSTSPDRLVADGTSQLTVDAALERPVPFPVTVTVDPPVAANGDPATTTIPAGESGGTAETTLTWPVAGTFAIADLTVSIADDRLFCQSVSVEAEQSVTVDPRSSSGRHVGRGGTALSTGIRERSAGRVVDGVVPAGVREYVAGDPARRIDWKTTARLDSPHVVEFEGRPDGRTLLVFDHRASMADGRPGARKLDHARGLALAVVQRTFDGGDQLGYYAVGDEGLTTLLDPSHRTDNYRLIRDRLGAVEPTPAAVTADATGDATRVRSAADRLAADDTAFGRTLAPYVADSIAYRERVDSQPLYRAVTSAASAASDVVQTVVVTDDGDRDELRAAVTAANRAGEHVTVYLTPSVLYETSGGTDVGRAYRRYLDFEEFRRELAAIGRVDAYEVGPTDRLSTVLSAGRDRRPGRNA